MTISQMLSSNQDIVLLTQGILYSFKKSNLLFFIEGKGDDKLSNFKLKPTPISLSFTPLTVTSIKKYLATLSKM